MTFPQATPADIREFRIAGRGVKKSLIRTDRRTVASAWGCSRAWQDPSEEWAWSFTLVI